MKIKCMPHRHSRKGTGPVAALAAALLLAAALSGCGAEKNLPAAAAEEDAQVERIEGLSAAQSRTVAEFGYPDHFFISFDPANSDRVERWVYFSLGKALDFDNGRPFGEEAVEDESVKYPPTALRPQDFDVLMTPDEATQLLGEPVFTHEVEDSLMPENTIIVYEKVVLLYRGEKLIGVNTQVRPPDLENGSQL